MKIDLPPLAQAFPIGTYSPQFGDYVVWAKWFSTWHGIVADYDKDSESVKIIFEGLPYLLFNLDTSDYEKNTYTIRLAKIRGSVKGVWAILRHDTPKNSTYWYV